MSRGGFRRFRASVYVLRIVIRCFLMAHAVSVRLDGEALLALRQLEAEGMSRSEAIRSALVAAAAQRYDKHVLAEQVTALEADDDDRAEMLAVADIMESLRAPG